VEEADWDGVCDDKELVDWDAVGDWEGEKEDVTVEELEPDDEGEPVPDGVAERVDENEVVGVRVTLEEAVVD